MNYTNIKQHLDEGGNLLVFARNNGCVEGRVIANSWVGETAVGETNYEITSAIQALDERLGFFMERKESSSTDPAQQHTFGTRFRSEDYQDSEQSIREWLLANQHIAVSFHKDQQYRADFGVVTKTIRKGGFLTVHSKVFEDTLDFLCRDNTEIWNAAKNMDENTRLAVDYFTR